MSSITEATRQAHNRAQTEVESSHTKGGLFSMEGRIGRLEYFWIVLSTALIGNVLFLWVSTSDAKALSLWIAVPAILLVAYVGIAGGVKRCHDLDKSGWLYVLVAIPLINVVLGLYLLFAAGSGRSNQHGSSPRSTTDSAHESSMPMQPPSEMTGKHHANDIATYATIAALPEGVSQPSTRSIKALDSEQISGAAGTSKIPAEEFWAAAILEVEGANRRPGLWARVFSEARGDERIANADYLRERSMELQNDFDKLQAGPEKSVENETQVMDDYVEPEAVRRSGAHIVGFTIAFIAASCLLFFGITTSFSDSRTQLVESLVAAKESVASLWQPDASATDADQGNAEKVGPEIPLEPRIAVASRTVLNFDGVDVNRVKEIRIQEVQKLSALWVVKIKGFNIAGEQISWTNVAVKGCELNPLIPNVHRTFSHDRKSKDWVLGGGRDIDQLAEAICRNIR